MKRKGLITGAVAAAVALLALYTAASLLPIITYPPARVAALFIALTPGDFATAMIERLGHGAIRGLSIAMNIGAVALGGVAGLLIAKAKSVRRKAQRAAGAGAVLLALSVVLNIASPEGWSFAATGAYALAAYFFARTIAGTPLSVALEPELKGPETPLDAIQRSRRKFIIRAATLVGGIIVGGGAMLRTATRRTGELLGIVSADRPFVSPADDSGFPKVEGHSLEITPNDSFYNVDINIVKPSVDSMDWRLKVHGLVTSPFELDYRQLQNDFEVVEMAHTLTCISNEVGGDLISTAVWRGVRLKDVLARAGLKEGTVDLVFRAAEGYSDSTPVAKGLEDTTLVVFGMNGVALPRQHGFPARIIVPGIYGMKNVKWLTEIEAVDTNYQGYWMVRGWSDIARIKTESRIDVPSHSSRVALPAMLAGVAWAGDRGILRVEVSEDQKNWKPALLKRELSPVAWRLWAVDIEPGSGSKQVYVRAVDGDGDVQTSKITKPHPDGASGYDFVVFELGA